MEKNGFFYSRETKGRKTAERGEKMKERYQILYKGGEGEIVAMESFGASGPAAQLFEKFGFTADNVADKAKSSLAKAKN